MNVQIQTFPNKYRHVELQHKVINAMNSHTCIPCRAASCPAPLHPTLLACAVRSRDHWPSVRDVKHSILRELITAKNSRRLGCCRRSVWLCTYVCVRACGEGCKEGTAQQKVTELTEDPRHCHVLGWFTQCHINVSVTLLWSPARQ